MPGLNGLGAVADVSFSSDGELVAWTAEDRTVGVGDVATGRERFRVTLDSCAHTVLFSPDDARLATSSHDGGVVVLDAQTGGLICRIRPGFVAGVVSWGPDGSWIAVSGGDGTVQRWDVGSGERRWERADHEDWVLETRVSPDGASIATASFDGTCRVYDADTGEERARDRFEAEVWSLAFSPDSAAVVACGSGESRTVRVFDAHSGAPRWHLDAAGFVSCVAFSPDGRLVFADYSIWHPPGHASVQVAQLLDSATGAEWSNIVYDGDLLAVTWRPRSAWVVVGSRSDARSVQVVDIETGWVCDDVPGHPDGLRSAVFSPDGTRLAIICRDGTGRVHDLRAAQTGFRTREPVWAPLPSYPMLDTGP